MSDPVQVLGAPPEVMADPRVQNAMQQAGSTAERDAAQELLGGEVLGTLDKYGLKLRPLSLTVVGPMMVQLQGFKPSFPEAWYMQAMLFLLGAPLREVYAGLAVGESEGSAAFMAVVAEWLQASGLPQEIGGGVAQAIARTFATAAKLSPGGEASKNVEGQHGS